MLAIMRFLIRAILILVCLPLVALALYTVAAALHDVGQADGVVLR